MNNSIILPRSLLTSTRTGIHLVVHAIQRAHTLAALGGPRAHMIVAIQSGQKDGAIEDVEHQRGGIVAVGILSPVVNTRAFENVRKVQKATTKSRTQSAHLNAPVKLVRIRGTMLLSFNSMEMIWPVVHCILYSTTLA